MTQIRSGIRRQHVFAPLVSSDEGCTTAHRERFTCTVPSLCAAVRDRPDHPPHRRSSLLSFVQMRCRVCLVLALALLALVAAFVTAELHAVRIVESLAAAAEDGADFDGDSSHIVFVEDGAVADSVSAAGAKAGVDLSQDPSGHSPFRVRHEEIDGMTQAELEAQVDGGIAQHHTTLLEHKQAAAAPAPHSIDIALTRSMATPQTVEAVMLEVRSRQAAASDNHLSFIEMGEGAGDSQEEMELDAQIEADAAEQHDAYASSDLDDADVSALEIRSRDVPLYQEVLKEKHLATYYGTLRIGDTLFRVLFDTGSCELWIPSDKCSTARCNRHKRFPEDVVLASLGSTATATAATTPIASAASPSSPAAAHKKAPSFFGKTRMNIEYISGKVSGPMVVADVGVGGLVVPNQILGLAHRLDIELLDEVVWDGIVGLAFPSRALVTKGVTPLFDNIISQGLLTRATPKLANQFAYYIDDTQGQMTFGGVNCAFVVKQSQPLISAEAQKAAEDACKNSFSFVPVTRKTYWTLTLDDVSLSYPLGVPVPAGQKLSGNCGRYGCRAIIDTGTYLVYTSKFFQTPAAWGSFSHCGHTSALPNITFTFRTDGVRDRIPGTLAADSGRTVSLTLEPREYVLKFDNSRSKEDCVVGISPDKDAVFTLGQVFLRSYYALFDRDENRIGFSKIHRQGHEAVNARPSKPVPAHVASGVNEGL